MLTIVTIAVPIVLVAIIAAIWWVMRDPTPPPTTARLSSSPARPDTMRRRGTARAARPLAVVTGRQGAPRKSLRLSPA
jgi:hypothetical protein